MIDFEAPFQRPMRNLSVSKIEQATMCGLRFRFMYVDRIPRLSAWVLLAGNVVHEIVEKAIREFARSGKYPDWKTMDDMFEPAWERRAAEEEAKEGFIGWEERKDDAPEKIRREYRPLVRIAREQVLKDVRPWMIDGEPVVEYRIGLELQSDAGSFALLGYADLLTDDGVLQDWKTTEGDVSHRQKRTWLQFAAYSLWAYPLVGEENIRCRKIFLVRGTNPRVEFKDFVMTREHREWFVKEAAKVWMMVKSGLFLAGTEGWWCSPDFCPYYGGCRGEIPGELELIAR